MNRRDFLRALGLASVAVPVVAAAAKAKAPIVDAKQMLDSKAADPPVMTATEVLARRDEFIAEVER